MWIDLKHILRVQTSRLRSLFLSLKTYSKYCIYVCVEGAGRGNRSWRRWACDWNVNSSAPWADIKMWVRNTFTMRRLQKRTIKDEGWKPHCPSAIHPLSYHHLTIIQSPYNHPAIIQPPYNSNTTIKPSSSHHTIIIKSPSNHHPTKLSLPSFAAIWTPEQGL